MRIRTLVWKSSSSSPESAWPAPRRAGYDLTWSAMDGGGATSTGGGYELSGTVGQAGAGELSGEAFKFTVDIVPGKPRGRHRATLTLVLAILNALMLMIGARKLRAFSLGCSGRSAVS